MTKLLLAFVQQVGLLARAALDNDKRDFLAATFAIRKLCDIAQQQLTFRVIDPVGDTDEDDEETI